MKKRQNSLRNFLKEPNNIISTTFGIIVTALTILWKDILIPMWILGTCLIILMLVIWSLIRIIICKQDEYQIIKPIKWLDHHNYKNILLIEKYDFLSPNALVTVFIVDDFEEYFCTGIILNETTTKGYNMVRIEKINRYYNRETMPDVKQLVIKPIITTNFYEE